MTLSEVDQLQHVASEHIRMRNVAQGCSVYALSHWNYWRAPSPCVDALQCDYRSHEIRTALAPGPRGRRQVGRSQPMRRIGNSISYAIYLDIDTISESTDPGETDAAWLPPAPVKKRALTDTGEEHACMRHGFELSSASTDV